MRGLLADAPLKSVRGMPDTAWLEVGGRGLDTAMMYGDDVQLHMGDAIEASGLPREQLFVTSKVPCSEGWPLGLSSSL